MTRNDYEKVARLIKGLSVGTLANTSCGGFTPSLNDHGFHCETLIDCFCDMFSSDYARFNKKKFIKACGFDPWDELINGFPILKKEEVKTNG